MIKIGKMVPNFADGYWFFGFMQLTPAIDLYPWGTKYFLSMSAKDVEVLRGWGTINGERIVKMYNFELVISPKTYPRFVINRLYIKPKKEQHVEVFVRDELKFRAIINALNIFLTFKERETW